MKRELPLATMTPSKRFMIIVTFIYVTEQRRSTTFTITSTAVKIFGNISDSTLVTSTSPRSKIALEQQLHMCTRHLHIG